ncbi:MAG: transposase [bacterium]|nr:transposase [bacterium]
MARKRRGPASITAGPIDLIIDSTGLSIARQSEWAASKQEKRGWRKLHIGVNGAGEIIEQVVIGGNVNDTKTGVELIAHVQIWGGPRGCNEPGAPCAICGGVGLDLDQQLRGGPVLHVATYYNLLNGEEFDDFAPRIGRREWYT